MTLAGRRTPIAEIAEVPSEALRIIRVGVQSRGLGMVEHRRLYREANR